MIEMFKQYGSNFYFIDESGKEHQFDKIVLDKFIAEEKYTIKIEGLESYYNNLQNKTVHAFIAPKNAQSFPLHQDPYTVEIYCVEGIKSLFIDGLGDIEIKQFEKITIPKNVFHKATNKYNSIILSIGD